MTDNDLIAAFLEKKGATVIPEGQRTTTEREVYQAVRGETPAPKPDRLASTDHLGRETWVNAEGEVVYHG